MLMNPPPGNSFTTMAQNRGATQSLAAPGLQRRPVLGQNLSGMPGSPALSAGMPQLSPNPINPQNPQMAMMAKLLAGGGYS